MLTNMKEILAIAKENNYAIPQFNINNLEWTRFILEECEKEQQPVILGVSEGTIKYMGGYKTISNLVKNLIEDLNITIPVSIHLDHGSLESCKKAIEAGFTSVMIDSSKKSIEENIKDVQQVIELAHPNIIVEAEVGPIGIEKTNKNYTNLEDCIKLEKTNIDLLAPAIGNKHGKYEGPVSLDLNLLKEIKNKTHISLVLHGASGIPDELIKECIKNGITKINFNTELQIAWSNKVREYIKINNTYDPRLIIKSGEEALKEKIKEKLELLK